MGVDRHDTFLLAFRKGKIFAEPHVILNWFDTSEVKQFAHSIAAQYDRSRKSSALRMDDASKRLKKFDKLVAEVREFERSKKLNIYKKAKLAKEIGNGLREQGIPEPEISVFVDSLLVADLSPHR